MEIKKSRGGSSYINSSGLSHYERNKDYYRSKRLAREKTIKELVRQAKNKPCADCAVSYNFYVMQFDHVNGDKEFNLAHAHKKGWSDARVLSEIAKCEVVCANCHAERTYKRRAAVV